MVMALRSAAALAAAPRGFFRLCSTSSSTLPFLSSQAAASTPACEQAEPNTNLFVSGLSKRTTSEGLREAFAKFGEVVHAKVVTDRVSGYSKGFGFVRYSSLEDAANGIKGMDGSEDRHMESSICYCCLQSFNLFGATSMNICFGGHSIYIVSTLMDASSPVASQNKIFLSGRMGHIRRVCKT